MIARIFRLSIALFVSAAAWLQQPVATISCGPYYEGESWHITCFDPRVLPDSLFGEFLFTIGDAAGMTSGEEFDYPEGTEVVYDRNIHDWSEYLGGRVPLADIDAFVYGDSLRTLERLMRVIRDGEPMFSWPDSSGAMTARDIVERRDTAMLRYMIFAKLCEPYSSGNSDVWNAAWTDSIPEIPALIERGRAELAACHDGRLRVRYGYQIVRLAEGLDDTLAIELYDTYVAPSSSRLAVRYYAALNCSRALSRLGRRAEALYLLSLVYGNCDDRAWPALFYFSIPSDSTWDSTYALARSDHERYVLWMMRGIREYRLDTRPMEMMMKLEPRNPRLDVMLMREVREVERKLFSERVTRPAKRDGKMIGHGSAQVSLDGWTWAEWWRDSSDDDHYPARLARFAERTADAGRVSNRAFWYAVAGYMRIISGDFSAAEHDLDRAGRNVSEDGSLRNQIEVLRLLARARGPRYLSTDIASRYTAALSLIKAKRKPRYEEDVEQSPVLMLLGQKYLLQGDVLRASAAFDKGGNPIATRALLDIYATDADLLKLQRLLERPRPRSIDSFLFARYPFSAAQILDLRATRLMRRGRFAAAVRLWEELDRYPKNAGDTVALPTDDTFVHFTAVIDTMLPGETGPAYRIPERKLTRPEFARQMALFERRAARSRRDRVRYSYAIATALRSQPYWGYSSQIWDGSLVYALRYFARPVEYPFNDPIIARRMARAQVTFLREYGSNEIAWRYLDRARRATDNREIAAACAFEMDEALKNPQTSLHEVPERQNRTGYNLLRTRYRETVVAKRELSNCGTYEYFRAHR